MMQKFESSSVSTRSNAPPMERRKRFCQFVLIGFVLLLAVVMPAAAVDIEEVYFEVKDNTTLEKIIEWANAAENKTAKHYTIGIVGDSPRFSSTHLFLGKQLVITGNVTLTPSQKDTRHDGTLYLQREDYQNQYLFMIQDGGSLTVCGNVTKEKRAYIRIDGANTCEGSLVYVGNNGKFTLDGSIVGGKAEKGAGVYVDSGQFFMKDGAIQGNTATENGGGVYIDNDGYFEMVGGTIGGGNNAKNGAGVYVNDGTFKMGWGTIVQNTATENGGGVYVNNEGFFDMTGGNIWKNNQAVNGAGVYINDGTFNLVEGTIGGNTASTNGGGIYLNSGSLALQEGTISQNTARVDGGGLYLENGATVDMTGGSLNDNSAEYGGGVYVQYSCFNMTAIGENTPTVSNNNAKHGGGVYVNGGINGGDGFKLFAGTLSGNTATTQDNDNEDGTGGAIYIKEGSVLMGRESGEEEGEEAISTFGTLISNNAEKGSAVYAASGTLFNMSAGDIKENTAGLEGFAVFIDGGTFDMMNGNITDNKASLFGGVYVDGTFNLGDSGHGFTIITGNSGRNTFLSESTTITILKRLHINTNIGVTHYNQNSDERTLFAQGPDRGYKPDGTDAQQFFSDQKDYSVEISNSKIYLVYDPEEPEPEPELQPPKNGGSSVWIQAPGGSYGLYTGTVNNGGTVSFPQSSPVEKITLPAGFSGDVIVSTEKDPTLSPPPQGTVYRQFDVSTTTAIPYGTTATIGVSIPASDIPQGMGIYVFHYQGAEKKWVIEPSTATINGEKVFVTAPVSGFSPFAIVFDETGVIPTETVNADIAPPLENPGVVATPAESPAPVVGVLMGILAGLAVLGVRRG